MSLDRLRLVVDASVGVKWYVPEDHSEEARQLLQPGIQLHVPSLFFTEVTQTIWKKAHLRHEIDRTQGREILSKLSDAPVEVHDAYPLLGAAFEVALETGRTVYDSVYLVLAQALGCQLVTADLKLYNSLRSTPLGDSMIWIAVRTGDSPGLP